MKLAINESTMDRVIRVVLGVALIVVSAAGWVAAPVVFLTWLLGAVGLVTGIVGFCPLYAILHLSTAPAER